MAHEVESMFSVRETPWHGLGTILNAAPTAADAIRAAGLEWAVEKRPLFLADGRAVEAGAIVRTTDDRILGHHVGPGYTPLQNADAFAWFDPFLATGEATLETAGSLRDGAIVWALAKLVGDSVIVPKSDDRVSRYILLSNSHNGTTSVRAGETNIRVVCANTLVGAHNDGASALTRIRHTANMHDVMASVRDLIQVAHKRFDATAAQYRELAARRVRAADVARYVAEIFDAPVVGPAVTAAAAPARKVAGDASLIDEILGGDELMADVLGGRIGKEDRKMANARARQETIETLFEKGRGNDLEGVKGTWWALYNGVTEYMQYERPRSTATTRLDSLTFGPGAVTSRKALGLALEMAHA